MCSSFESGCHPSKDSKATRIALKLVALGISVALSVAPKPALAVDGCKVLLCLAAPSWRSIPQCVPVIQDVMRDLARGRPFPVCTMSGNGNNAQHQWASAPANCPAQYTRLVDVRNGPHYICDYVGAISIDIDGAPWSRIWWQVGGDSVTEFLPAAKARLGTWDTRFDDDHARWLASQPQPAPY
jgi:hypothetical protein